jgi:hypothetical protein
MFWPQCHESQRNGDSDWDFNGSMQSGRPRRFQAQIRTMIVGAMLAWQKAVLSKRNADDSNPARQIATAYATRFVLK